MRHSALFTPFASRSVTLRNRVVMPPMCQYSAVDGVANDWHLMNAGARAAGGVGMVIVEATGVEARGRITPGCLGLWSDEQGAALTRVAAFIKSQGAVAAIQIGHAGRKASCALPWDGGKQLGLDEGGWETVAPSPVPFAAGERTPRELTKAEIVATVELSVASAKRALAAGFEVLEIHGAHGYLISEFLCPLINQRTDEYGGSFANRCRLAVEVTEALRAVWPAELPLWFRISATDWMEDGWGADDTVALARELKAKGVDLMDCSTGGVMDGAKIPAAPGFQVAFAERVRREAGLATGAVGMIRSPELAEAIVAEGRADVVLVGRELLRNPHWTWHAARQLGAAPAIPNQYLRAE